jgi:hypothetical protein
VLDAVLVVGVVEDWLSFAASMTTVLVLVELNHGLGGCQTRGELRRARRPGPSQWQKKLKEKKGAAVETKATVTAPGGSGARRRCVGELEIGRLAG